MNLFTFEKVIDKLIKHEKNNHLEKVLSQNKFKLFYLNYILVKKYLITIVVRLEID